MMVALSPGRSVQSPMSAPGLSSSPPQRARSFSPPRPFDPSSRSLLPPVADATADAKADAPASPDAFESHARDDAPEPSKASVDFDDLPIELVTLTDSFIDSLSARVHPTPPSIDKLARMFQDFYATASAHINTHVNSLVTRHQREGSPRPANPAAAVAAASSSSARTSSTASLLRAKAASLGASKEKPRSGSASSLARSDSRADQQMLTAEEHADRKRARRALELKRGHLEEAVERRLCEAIYDKIYRHHTTQDEAQDDKLRSKTAALAVVGIGPLDLGVDLGLGDSASDAQAVTKRQDEVRDWLEQARKELILMHEGRYPLGKLNHLKAAHKSIIDTLSYFHPSSSADELMPMLIYTLITLPPEHVHAISDVNFMQRFRWEAKLNGEAAYCLTNLEAAIGFLDTVDLSTLRADEHPSGPRKGSSSNISTRPSTPRAETFPPAYSQGLAASTPSLSTDTSAAPSSSAATTPSLKPTPSPTGIRAAVQLRNRRLSDLVNTPAQAFNAASDAVRTTADQGLKNISTSLGDSYRFFLGRFRETGGAAASGASTGGVGNTGAGRDVMVPKTLDDARKLINTPPPGGAPDDEIDRPSSVTSTPEVAAADFKSQNPGGAPPAPGDRSVTPSILEDKLLNLIGGRRAARDQSVDSVRSAVSGVGGAGSRKVTSTLATGASGGGGGGGGSSAAITSPPPPTANENASSSSQKGGGPGHRMSGSINSISGANPTSPSNPALMESMRSLGNTLNPITRFPGFRAFGKSASTSAPAPTATKDPRDSKPRGGAAVADGGDLATAFPDLVAHLPPKEAAKVKPPIRRFIELQDPGELRLGEVLDLLRDYRRLAAALKDAGAFRE